MCLCDTSITFKTAKMSADFSKIFKRLSTTTWFVRDYYGALPDFNQYDRWSNKWRSTIKGINLWWVPPLSCPNKCNNLSRQDAGQNTLCFRRQMADTNL